LETLNRGKTTYTHLAMEDPIQVHAFWDDDARVWVAESGDVPGLVTEAESVDQLIEKLKILIPELLAENGVERAGNIPFRLVSDIEVVSRQRVA
jgi:predicted RNase H-like HicB family nuclease